ncbi:MAG: molybdenum cofactor guanylyltransferase [Actinomycetota bacterium]
MATGFDAVVLAGGRATRLGGVDKALVEIGGLSLLDRALRAVRAADNIVAVGPRRRSDLRVRWVREEPPGAGPVHALRAGLEHVAAELVVVLAVDHPLVTERTIAAILGSARGRDGATLCDFDGHVQPLVGTYRRDVLTERIESLDRTEDAAMRELVMGLDLGTVLEPGAAMDCNTWEQVQAARSLIEGDDGDAG